jgi:1-acyl-sn-glycerol-3-phosphate acyltransferase
MPEVQKVLRSRPFAMGAILIVFKSFNLLCRIFLRMEVSGKENLATLKRPFLVCPNHQSYFDPFVVTGEYPFEHFKNSFVVGASQFFENSFMKSLADFLNTVPVDADTQLLKAMKASAVGLKHGKILNIFPEGARAFDGELHEFKKGAAILAVELDLPIVPVALDGFYKVWARSSNKISFAKTKLRFGKPIYPSDVLSNAGNAGGESADSRALVSTLSDEAKYELLTRHLQEKIRLMIEEMRSS